MASLPRELRSRYDDEQRERLRPPPGRRREDDGTLVRIVGPSAHPLDNMVCASRLTAATAEGAIRGLVEAARAAGRGAQWNVFGHDQPTDLVARLERQGFEVEARETVLALPSGTPVPPAVGTEGIEVRRVRDEAGLATAMEIQTAVWGPGHGEWLLSWWRPALRGEGDPIAIFLASIGGAPAGLAWVLLPPGATFANLFGATVLPAFRRRGVHGTLVAARARVAAEAGIPWLVVDANAHSAPLLLRRGFLPLTSRTDLVLAAAPLQK